MMASVKLTKPMETTEKLRTTARIRSHMLSKLDHMAENKAHPRKRNTTLLPIIVVRRWMYLPICMRILGTTWMWPIIGASKSARSDPNTNRYTISKQSTNSKDDKQAMAPKSAPNTTDDAAPNHRTVSGDVF
jgi:hypothetical protein